MASLGRHRSGTFLVAAAVCFLLDLTSKSWVTQAAQENSGPLELVPGWLHLKSPVLNKGMMWSLLHWLGDTANGWLAGLSAVAVVAIFLWGVRASERSFALVLGMILGGACGNLYDRIVHEGVRDFIDAHYYDVYHYPTFNLADSFLVCGVGLLLWGSMRSTHPPGEQPESLDGHAPLSSQIPVASQPLKRSAG